MRRGCGRAAPDLFRYRLLGIVRFQVCVLGRCVNLKR